MVLVLAQVWILNRFVDLGELASRAQLRIELRLVQVLTESLLHGFACQGGVACKFGYGGFDGRFC